MGNLEPQSNSQNEDMVPHLRNENYQLSVFLGIPKPKEDHAFFITEDQMEEDQCVIKNKENDMKVNANSFENYETKSFNTSITGIKDDGICQNFENKESDKTSPIPLDKNQSLQLSVFFGSDESDHTLSRDNTKENKKEEENSETKFNDGIENFGSMKQEITEMDNSFGPEISK